MPTAQGIEAEIPQTLLQVKSRNWSGKPGFRHSRKCAQIKKVFYNIAVTSGDKTTACYSIFRKPVWLPKRVYDDGRKTYIELDEKMLHTEAPVIFNHRNERINYRVKKNLVIIDELIEKITVRRGKEKVTITKKKYKAPVAAVPDTPQEQ